MKPLVTSPKYDSADFTDVPYVDAAAVYHEEDEALTIFAVNKSKELMETEIKLRGFEDYRIIEHIVLEHQDMKATNQKNRKEVTPHSNGTSSANAEGITAHFTPLSWNVIRLSGK